MWAGNLCSCNRASSCEGRYGGRFFLIDHQCNSVHGSKELSICLSSKVFGLRLMSCKICGRPGGDPCSGCRTALRVHYLWKREINQANEVAALHLLRDCAGALTDLVEAQAGPSSASTPPRVAGVEPGNSKTAEASVVGQGPGEKAPLEVKVEEKEDEQKREKGAEAAPVEAKGKEDDSLSEEEGSEETEEEVPKAKDPEEKPQRFHRGSLSAPLGLKQLPKQLSPSDIKEKELKPGQAWFKKREDAEGSRSSRPEALPAPREPRPEPVRQPRSPSRPPGGWGNPERERSRSRHKRKKEKKERSSKGKKKRERGRDWVHSHYPGGQDRWHRKQKDSQKRR